MHFFIHGHNAQQHQRQVLAFVVGGLGFEFCVFIAGWRHALQSEWPFIIIIIAAAVAEQAV